MDARHSSDRVKPKREFAAVSRSFDKIEECTMCEANADPGDVPFHPAVAPALLAATKDVYGNLLEVGCRVRSFSSPFELEDGRVTGLEVRGPRVRYLEGVLLAIGEVQHEGCRRYSIRVDKRVSGSGGGVTEEPVPADDPWATVIPPLNGTPTTGGEHVFGVVRVLD
jgi:hypothetical protein